MQDDTFDVFISDSSKDRKVADVVKAHLSGLGVKCWMAPESIKPGEEWAEAIANVVPRCGLMVLLWTRESMQSRQVINELTLADCSGVMILPFRLEDIQPEGAFKYYLSKTHWLDAVDAAWKAKIALLGERVLHNLQWEKPVASNLADGEKIREKRPVNLRLAWLLGLACLFAVGIMGAFVFRLNKPSTAIKPPENAKQIDASVNLLMKLYGALTLKQYEKAFGYLDPSIRWQYKYEFFDQFDRITLQNLRVTSRVGSTVNLEGVVNFVWPDGSVQRETRSFSVDTSRQPPVLTASEFGAVVKSR